MVGYTDSDFVGSLDDRKNTYFYVFHLGSGLISCTSKKQTIVTLSLVEAKYVATCQEVWLPRVLDGLKQKQEGSATIYCGNTLAIALSKHSVFHQKSIHIDIRYLFIRDL